jgi:hypothetical protein
MRSAPCSEDQVAVAELVPQVSVLEGGVVAAREQLVAGGRAENVEV